MEFKEGQIFKGNITVSGGNDGPTKSWIVVSPFDKMSRGACKEWWLAEYMG